MVEELGPIRIPVVLDTTEAKREIQRVRAGMIRADARRREILGTDGERSGPSVSANLEGTGRKRGRTGGIARTVADGVSNRIKGAAAANPVNRLLSQVGASRVTQGIAGRFAGASTAAGVARAGGVLAATYAAASGLSKLAPPVLDAIEGALPEALAQSEIFQGLLQGAEEIRQQFTALESTVLGFAKAIGQTKDISVAALRLTGGLPDISGLMNQYTRLNTAERELEKKFERFKSRDLMRAIGDGFRKSFDLSANR